MINPFARRNLDGVVVTLDDTIARRARDVFDAEVATEQSLVAETLLFGAIHELNSVVRLRQQCSNKRRLGFFAQKASRLSEDVVIEPLWTPLTMLVPGYRLQLPVDETENLPGQTVDRRWVIDFPNNSRPINWDYCDLTRVETERYTGDRSEEPIYRILAYKRVMPEGGTIVGCDIDAYSHGVKDDPLLLEAKEATHHALGLVNKGLNLLQ